MPALGDPAKAGQAVLAVAGMDDPPLRLILGGEAYAYVVAIPSQRWPGSSAGWADDDCACDNACSFFVAGANRFGEEAVRQSLRASADGSQKAGDGSFHLAAAVERRVEGTVEVAHDQLEREGACQRGDSVVELAISTDDVLVCSVGNRFLERGNYALELDQSLPGPALSGERRGAFVADGGRLSDGPADPANAESNEVRDQLERSVAPVVEHTAPLAMLAVDEAEQLEVCQDLADSGPVDTELQGKLTLGWQFLAGRDVA